MDRAADINSQIAAAPDGSPSAWTYIRFPTGEAIDVYSVDSRVLIDSKRYIVLEGPSAANKARLHRSVGNGERHIELRNCFRVRVRNLHVTGINGRHATYTDYAASPSPGAQEAEIAFQVSGSVNCDFEDCDATDVLGYLNCAGPLMIGSNPSRYCAFRRIKGLRVGGWGFAATYCDHIDCDDVTYDKSSWGAADFEANAVGETITNLTFRRWIVDTYGFGFISHQDGIVQDVLFEECHVKRHNYFWGMVDIRNANGATKRGQKRRIHIDGFTNEWNAIYDTENSGSAVGGPWAHLFTFTSVDDVTVENCDMLVRNDGTLAAGGLAVVAELGPTADPGFVRVKNNRAKGAPDSLTVAFLGGTPYDLDEETKCGNDYGATYDRHDPACL